jgi:hypothetical protein
MHLVVHGTTVAGFNDGKPFTVIIHDLTSDPVEYRFRQGGGTGIEVIQATHTHSFVAILHRDLGPVKISRCLNS